MVNRGRLRSVLVLYLCGIALLAFASTAIAAPKTTVNTLGAGPGATGGFFNNPRGVAVNQSGAGGVAKGTFYVVDSSSIGNNRIQRFGPSGEFISGWGWGVKDNEAEFQICKAAANCLAGLGGAGAGQLGSGGAQGIAVDQVNGTVYVTDQVNRRVNVFTAAGTPVGAFGWKVKVTGAAEELQLCGVLTGCQAGVSGAKGGQFAAALGNATVAPAGSPSAGDILVANKTQRRIDEFKPTFESGALTSVAFVRAFGFDVEIGGVTTFEVCTVAASCKQGTGGAGVGQFASTNSPSDVAIDSEGNIFAVDLGNKRVEEFSSVPVPVTATFGATALTSAFGTGERLGIAIADDHVFVSGKRSTSSPVNRVAVAELDHSGNAVDLHGAELAPNTASGLAAAGASSGGNLYLTSSNGNRVFVLGEAPTVASVTEFTATTAVLKGEVVSNEIATKYHFEYSTDGSNWTKIPVEDAEVGPAPGKIAVEAEATGLTGSQLYHVRLAQSRAGAGSVVSADVTFTTLAAKPVISSGGVSGRTDAAATLEAAINPQNQASTYHFEYTDKADFEANGYANAIHVPAPEASAGSGGQPVAVSQPIAGLAPGTDYVFRALATNPTGTTEGADHSFVTFDDLGVEGDCPNEEIRLAQGTTYMPDCRAFELVNSPDKGNHIVKVPGLGNDVPFMTPGGEGMIWSELGGAPGAPTGGENFFRAERSSGGWESTAIAPEAVDQIGNGNLEYRPEPVAPEFSLFLGRVKGPGEESLVLLDRAREQTLLKTYPTGRDLPSGCGACVELTADGSHVLAVDPATDQIEDVGLDALPGEVVSLLPDGTEPSCGVSAFIGRSTDVLARQWRPGYRWASTDSTRAYFQARQNGDCVGSLDALYVRNRAADVTTLIDAGTEQSPEFIRATPDGKHAYFVTFSKLDLADTNEHGDVYRWDEDAGGSTCLTCLVNPDANLFFSFPNGFFFAPVLVSDDFSHIYFESTEQLVPGEGQAGDVNIYALAGGAVHFVADPNDSESALRQGLPLLSENGEVFVFVTEHGAPDLTADLRSELCISLVSGNPSKCGQLYRFDDGTGGLECISCLHGGVTSRPVSQERSDAKLSADGSTVAFTTEQGLVPGDVNGGVDVYEWRGGAQRLITDGTSELASTATRVQSVDEDGTDIFITTLAPGLTGFEQDNLTNLYDARIGGGFRPPPPPIHCNEESCQGLLQAAPAADRPGSAAYAGPGNGQSKPNCAKGRVRRRGRCVKPRRPRRNQHRRARADHVEQGRNK